MKLLQYLKALADISFLYAIVGSIVAIFLGCDVATLPMFLLPIILPLGYALRGKAYRFLAFAPALLCFIGDFTNGFTSDFTSVIMPIVSLCYLFFAMKGEQYHYIPYQEVERFHHQLIAFPFLLGFGVLFGFGALLSAFTLPTMIVYLVASNLFLRLIRADGATLAQPSFLGAHLVSLAALLGAATLLSSQQLRSAIFAAISFLYNGIVVPILVSIGMVILYAVMAVIYFFMWLFGGVTLEEAASATADYSVLSEFTEESVLNQNVVPAWVETALTVAAALLIIALVVYLIRKMLSGIRQKKADDFITITTQSIAPDAPQKAPLLSLTPRQKVRAYYASLMRYAKKKGIRVTRATDTTQLSQKLGITPETVTLTDTYRHARYDEVHLVTKAEAAAAKAALKAIKAKQK